MFICIIIDIFLGPSKPEKMGKMGVGRSADGPTLNKADGHLAVHGRPKNGGLDGPTDGPRSDRPSLISTVQTKR